MLHSVHWSSCRGSCEKRGTVDARRREGSAGKDTLSPHSPVMEVRGPRKFFLENVGENLCNLGMKYAKCTTWCLIWILRDQFDHIRSSEVGRDLPSLPAVASASLQGARCVQNVPENWRDSGWQQLVRQTHVAVADLICFHSRIDENIKQAVDHSYTAEWRIALQGCPGSTTNNELGVLSCGTRMAKSRCRMGWERGWGLTSHRTDNSPYGYFPVCILTSRTFPRRRE